MTFYLLGFFFCTFVSRSLCWHLTFYAGEGSELDTSASTFQSARITGLHHFPNLWQGMVGFFVFTWWWWWFVFCLTVSLCSSLAVLELRGWIKLRLPSI